MKELEEEPPSRLYHAVKKENYKNQQEVSNQDYLLDFYNLPEICNLVVNMKVLVDGLLVNLETMINISNYRNVNP